MRQPLIQKAGELFSEISLDGVLCIACQHVLGTTKEMLEELIERGLKPEHIFLLGKCYSTSDTVYQDLTDLGVYVSPLSKAYKSHESFDTQHASHIEEFLTEVQGKVELNEYQKIVILDDGGSLIAAVNEISGLSNVVGVEQTSSGYQRLKSLGLKYPVVNVARSQAKLELEAPFIAEKAVEILLDALTTYQILEPRVLVVGQGAIGKAFVEQLPESFQAEGHDLLSHGESFVKTHGETLKNFDIIVGATGQEIIERFDLNLLSERVILASISSSDREFSAVWIRRYSTETSDCHKDVVFGSRVLLNSGFPINFTGEEHSVAPEKIQLTRALLLAGVAQALKLTTQDAGLIDMDRVVSGRLVREFSRFVN